MSTFKPFQLVKPEGASAVDLNTRLFYRYIDGGWEYFSPRYNRWVTSAIDCGEDGIVLTFLKDHTFKELEVRAGLKAGRYYCLRTPESIVACDDSGHASYLETSNGMWFDLHPTDWPLVKEVTREEIDAACDKATEWRGCY